MKDFFCDNTRIIFEIIILIFSVIILFQVPDEIVGEYSYAKDSIGIIFNMLVLWCGKIAFSIAMSIGILYLIRKYNSDYIMNQGNIYHRYPYWWYWFASRILGIKKCNLILVPIYLQYKLVINAIFQEYPYDEKSFPVLSSESIKVTREPDKEIDSNIPEINLILEDTYPIQEEQIPKEEKFLYTLKISRNNPSNTGVRYYSPDFIKRIQHEVRNLPDDITVNIFATTNPVNNLYIAKDVFQLANRGNIRSLYIYQQSNKEKRNFEPRGYRGY
jgi:hypothetical protein